MSVPNVRGRIVEFNRDTCYGVVTYDLSPVRFHSTMFYGRDWPRVGQRVELAFNDRGALLAVYALPDADE